MVSGTDWVSCSIHASAVNPKRGQKAIRAMELQPIALITKVSYVASTAEFILLDSLWTWTTTSQSRSKPFSNPSTVFRKVVIHLRLQLRCGNDVAQSEYPGNAESCPIVKGDGA